MPVVTTRGEVGEAHDRSVAEVGVALSARAQDVIDRVLAQWRYTATVTEERATVVEEDISRAALGATLAVSDSLVTGKIGPNQEVAGWGWSGTAPLASDLIPLSEVTGIYVRTRLAIAEVLGEVAQAAGVADDVRRHCEAVTHQTFDMAIVRMTKRFESTRHELEDALAENQVRLEHLTLHDPLTGLPNRVLLLDRVEHAVCASLRRPTRPAVLFMDLDHFKSVNDLFGHSAGDQLLTEVARRLRAVVRPNDTVARLGGDEFVVLCEELVDPLQGAVLVARRIVASLELAFAIGGRDVHMSASIGVAPFDPGDTAEGLMARADQAMYRAKDLGRGRIEVYDPEVDRLTTRSREISGRYRRPSDAEPYGGVRPPEDEPVIVDEAFAARRSRRGARGEAPAARGAFPARPGRGAS